MATLTPTSVTPTAFRSDSLIFVGYLTAFCSVLILPVPIALAGIICGCLNLSRGREGNGIMQIILNATCGILGTMLGYMAIMRMGGN